MFKFSVFYAFLTSMVVNWRNALIRSGLLPDPLRKAVVWESVVEKPAPKNQRLWERCERFILADGVTLSSSPEHAEFMRAEKTKLPTKRKIKRRKKSAEKLIVTGSPIVHEKKRKPRRVHRVGKRENLVLTALREDMRQECFVYACRKNFTQDEMNMLLSCVNDRTNKSESVRVSRALKYGYWKAVRSVVGKKQRREKAKIERGDALQALQCLKHTESAELWQLSELTEGMNERCKLVASLLAQGFEQGTIAKRLGLSKQTVSRCVNLIRDIVSADYQHTRLAIGRMADKLAAEKLAAEKLAAEKLAAETIRRKRERYVEFFAS